MQMCISANENMLIPEIRTFALSANLQINKKARELGFEPRSKVLETRMLPLHHSRKKASPPSKGGLQETYYLKNL